MLPKPELQWARPEPTEIEVVVTIPVDQPTIVKTVSIRQEPPPENMGQYAHVIILTFIVLTFAIAISVLLMCARGKKRSNHERDQSTNAAKTANILTEE